MDECREDNECKRALREERGRYKIFSVNENDMCVNTTGSYQCKCNWGFELDSSEQKCVGKQKERRS